MKANVGGDHINEADVIAGEFYWVWIDASCRQLPNLLPALVVAQPWREPQSARVMWEGCGSDEGVRVISIVARVERPRLLEQVPESTS